MITNFGPAFARSAVLASALVTTAGLAHAQSGEVNVYTYRESKLIQPLFEAFTKDTGIKVNVISASSGLEQRIKAEGANSPADVLLDGRHRPHRGRGARRRQPADQVRDARQDRARPIPRPRRPLVRHLDARARGLRLEAARNAERDHLRGTGRSEVEGQDLHPLRPAHLQQRAVCGLHRPPRRGQDRGMAQGPQGQPRAEAVRRRPRDGARHRRRQVRSSASATPTTGR